MANSRTRKSAPTRPGTARDQRSKTSGTGSTTAPADVAADPKDEPKDEPADSIEEPDSPAVPAPKPKKPAASKPGSASARPGGKRFGDGAGASAAGKAPGSRSGGKSGGRGGRGGRSTPAVRVGPSKPWGMIAATVAVVLFAVAAIGYAVNQANNSAVPDSPEDIDGISVAEYTPGQEHVMTDETYEENPPVGGPHDGYWADCDGAVYEQQIRSENAVHSMEHGAVWITYNPDEISDEELAVLTGYVANQPYSLLSPYAGLSSPISLQSWNHQLFVDAVEDPRINAFIQVLRQNPEEYPEVGASCSQPTFLADPVLEGEQSRVPTDGSVVTDAPSTP